MKLKIHAGKVRLFFWLPLSLIKSRLGLRIATKAMEDTRRKSADYSQDEVAQDFDAVPAQTTFKSDLEATPTEVCGADAPDKNSREQSVPVTRKFLKEVYNVLKAYVKQNGHFNLVDIVADNGKTKVEIRI